MYRNAIRLALERLQLNPANAVALAGLGHYHASLGEPEQALAYLERATAEAPKDMYVRYFAATALCALDQRERALAELERAVELGYPRHLVAVDAGFACLRTDPRYPALVGG